VVLDAETKGIADKAQRGLEEPRPSPVVEVGHLGLKLGEVKEVGGRVERIDRQSVEKALSLQIDEVPRPPLQRKLDPLHVPLYGGIKKLAREKEGVGRVQGSEPLVVVKADRPADHVPFGQPLVQGEVDILDEEGLAKKACPLSAKDSIRQIPQDGDLKRRHTRR